MSTPDVRNVSSPASPLTGPAYLADEAALRRAFDAQFADCLASAKAQLGEAGALAPRVVETAFINAYAQRATMTNDDHLKSILLDEIRHGSARALSRRHSGARFGAVGGGPGKAHEMAADHEAPDHVWEQIAKALHGAGHNAEARGATASASRHGTAAHIQEMSKRPGWIIPVAIGVFALVISVAGVMYVDRLGEDDAVLGIVANQSIQPIASQMGQIGSLNLGDGTKTRVGPSSKLYVPDGFGTKNRAVKVEGTATFDVAKGQTMPFRVVSRRVHFIATGTKFTISTFTKDTMPAIMVDEGSVLIKAGKNTATANAGQAMIVDANGIRAATADESAELFGWTHGQVTVRNKHLREVVEALSRWFNYDVKVPDLPLLDRPAALDVPLDSSKMAISQVEKSANVRFTYEGENKVFRDATNSKKK